VVGAAGVERGGATRAGGFAGEVLGDGEGVAAGAAEDGFGSSLVEEPDGGGVVGGFGVAVVAGVPVAAAVDAEGDDVEVAVPVGAAGLVVDGEASDGMAVGEAGGRGGCGHRRTSVGGGGGGASLVGDQVVHQLKALRDGEAGRVDVPVGWPL
jgi:hypothetical protein